MDFTTILAAVVLALLVNESTELSPYIARRLVRRAARWWTPDQTEAADLAEEWSALIAERPGKLFKVFTALSLAGGAIVHASRQRLASRSNDSKIVRRKVASAGTARTMRVAARVLGETLLLIGIGVSINIATSKAMTGGAATVVAWVATAGLAILIVALEVWQSVRFRPSTGDLVPYLRGQIRDDLEPLDALRDIPQPAKTWEDLSSYGRRAVVLGSPGSGKTTILRQIARQLVALESSESESSVPLLLDLSTWDPETQSVEGWISSKVHDAYAVDITSIKEMLAEGRALLLLDGLDHVPPSSRRLAAESIAQASLRSPSLGFIVVCTPGAFVDVADALRKFSVVEISGPNGVDLSDLLEGSVSQGLAPLASILEQAARESGSANSVMRDALVLNALAFLFANPVRENDAGRYDERLASILRLGAQLVSSGDYLAAEKAFRDAVAVVDHSVLSAVSLLLLGAVLNKVGDPRGAEDCFKQAADAAMAAGPRSYNPALEPRRVSERERQVIQSMALGATYNLAQVSSRALLVPSVTRETLESLERKGIVLAEDSSSGRRWKLSAYAPAGITK